MKSYRLTAFEKPLELSNGAIPEPTGREVLLKVLATGICHSDVHLWEGFYNLGNGKKYPLEKGGVALPLTLGHEITGIVLRTGPEATNVTVGKSYLVFPWIGCGQCAMCAAGDEHLCGGKPLTLGIYRDGGFADHLLVPDARYLLALDGLDPVTTAPYACSGLTAYSALKKAGIIIHSEPIVVIGAGGLGMMSIGLLKAMGGVGAVVVDLDEKKREAALAAGAKAVVDGSASDASNQISRAAGIRPRFVVDFVGSEQSAALAFNAVAKGGKIVIVGLFGGAAPWALPMFPLKAVTIQGSYVGNLAELRELLEMVRLKRIPPIPITRATLDQADAMLGSLRQGNVIGRVVLTP